MSERRARAVSLGSQTAASQTAAELRPGGSCIRPAGGYSSAARLAGAPLCGFSECGSEWAAARLLVSRRVGTHFRRIMNSGPSASEFA